MPYHSTHTGEEVDQAVTTVLTQLGSAALLNAGAADGVAQLDSSTKVPVAQLPDATGAAKGIVQLAGALGGSGSSAASPVLGAGAATDTAVGDRTVDDDLATPADTGDLTELLSWIAGRLKAITGAADWKTAPDATVNAVAKPYRTLWVGAEAMVPLTTNGAEAASEETTTNDIMVEHLLFDGSTQEFAQFKIAMPDEWDRSTVKFKIFWDAATGASAADGVVWGVKAGALSNDDAIDSALGSEITVSDVVIAVGDLHVTAASGALTVGGTPALGDLIWFQISRNPSDGSDDMTEDAKLLGIQIQYRETTPAAAW